MKSAKGFLGGVLLALSSLLHSAQLFAAETLPSDRPLYMAVFGDSVTRGTMADAQMGNPNARFYADLVRGQIVVGFYTLVGKIFSLPSPSEDDLNFIDKNFRHMSRLNLSAFVGSQSYSLPERLEQATSYRPRVYNGAILAAGYRTSDIPLTRFERYQRNTLRPQTPDMVVVNFNGMDFINNVSVPTFQKDVAHFFKRLKKLAPSALIFVTQLSDPIPLLTAPNQVAAPRSILMPNGLTCHDMYRQLQFGARAGLSFDSTGEQISAANDRLFAMRTILSEAVLKTNETHATGKVVLVENMFGQQGADALTYLSADCIHPNVAGHREIAKGLWETVSDYL